jgi:carbonic anhydrase
MSSKNVLKICAMLLIAIFLVSVKHLPSSAADHSYKEYSAAKEDRYEKNNTRIKEENNKEAVKDKETHAAASKSHENEVVTAEDALKKLIEGNKRYVEGKLSNPRRNSARRTELAKGQHPFAVILSCSDSRVPPEVIFDQGLGDLFVIRTAGHVVDEMAIGSIEYAVEHLGTQLIMVLGHERCGAVTAAVQAVDAPAHNEGEVCNICSIVNAIRPAIEKVKDKHGDLLENSVKANVKLVAEKLRSSKPVLAELVGDGLLKVVGGYYDLDSGAVTLTYNPCMVTVRE